MTTTRKPAARKTTVTHADGTVSTRASKTRTYSHAVEVGPAPAATYAARLTAEANRYEAEAAALRAAIASPQVVLRDRGLHSVSDYYAPDPMVAYEATLVGSKRISAWSNREGKTTRLASEGGGIEDVVNELVRRAEGQVKWYESEAAKTHAEAFEILAKGEPVGGYGVVRWSSRADLAARAISEFDYLVQKGHTVRVVEVDA